ncbi:hypothetical protein [Blastopirellula marina]|uniref:HEAT repeat domain-containing protein n=1 Tax=Blastopirellula marina TaxID=124 RepID=A0A2S8F4B7_9BACT|nr:hypothetical protein [Blastopirellula marina]PQO27015.1 hypothetical protein C5Y98_27545 [Blastopirellula marina]PTL41162.1 hypothetical protein C5Y97_27560 [Blastopirellula marina]
MASEDKHNPQWGVWLPLAIIPLMLLFQMGIRQSSVNSHMRFIEDRIARTKERFKEAQAKQAAFADSYASAQQELKEIQQLFLQRIQAGVPVVIDATFVKLADPPLIEQLEQAYRPLLDSPNPYHRVAAAKSLIMSTKDSPQQLLALLPQVLEIYVAGEADGIDALSSMNYSPFQGEVLERAIAELQKYLTRDDPATRVAAAELLLRVTWSDPARREEFRSQVFAELRPIVLAEQDENLLSKSISIVSQMKPEPDEWVPMLRQRIEQAPDWQRPDLARHVLQLDAHDQPTIQLLIDLILEDNVNWEYAQSILIEEASATEVRQAIQQTLKEKQLSEAKRTLLLSILDKLDRKHAKSEKAN